MKNLRDGVVDWMLYLFWVGHTLNLLVGWWPFDLLWITLVAYFVGLAFQTPFWFIVAVIIFVFGGSRLWPRTTN